MLLLARPARGARLIVASLALLLFAHHSHDASSIARQSTPAEAALAHLVRDYYDALAGENLPALMRLWSDKSPDFAARVATAALLFAAHDRITIGALTVSRVAIESERARAEVQVETSATIARSGKFATKEFGRWNRTLHFVREAGAWKVWREASPSEEELAAALVELSTDEERDALLVKASGYEGVELRRALIREAAQRGRQSKFKEAQAILHFARKLVERVGDEIGVADILRRIGANHFDQGEFAPAMDYYQKSLTASERAGDDYLTARALNNIGIVHHDRGEFDQALGYFRRALATGEPAGDKVMITAWLNNIGNCLRGLGDYETALEYYRRSVAMGEAARDKPGVALALSNVGVVHYQTGDYANALELFNKSLDVNQELSNKWQIARLSVLIGNVHLRQGDLDKGLTYYQKTLAVSEAAGIKYQIINALHSIGWYYELRGSYAEALDFYRKSLSAAESLDSKNQVAHILASIGAVHGSRGEYDAAVERFRESIKLLESLNIQGCVASTRRQLAEIQYLRGDYAGALPAAEQAAEVAARIGIREDLWRAHTTAGKVHLALGQPARARRAFDEAISVLETMRAGVVGGEHERQQFFDNKLAPYHLMIESLLSQNNYAEAFAYVERAKARVLLDVLQNGRAEIGGAMTANEREGEQRLKRALASLNTQLSKENGNARPDAPRLADLQGRVQTARLELEAFRAKLYAVHPELRAARGEAQPLDAGRAAELLPDDETALLEYVVTERKAYLFVLTKGQGAHAPTEVKAYALSVAPKDLSERAEEFRRLTAARGSFQPQARALYDLLLRPAAAQLKGKRRLVVVPDAALWEVPFQALQPAANRFLLEDAVISYAPSLTALAEMRKRRSWRDEAARPAALLAFGNPALNAEPARRAQIALRGYPLEPLAAAEREVAALRSLYGAQASRVYTGRDARERTVKQEAGHFRVLQFATHGVLDDRAPMYSHLVLSQAGDEANEDGLLEAWEMMNLNLRADLVVLSACETARGQIAAGEGVIGMSWALFVAGAPTTVVSGWKVSSEGTAELMVDFHRHLKGAGGAPPVTTAEALRRAALKLMRSGGAYRHPFYWAAFAVVGDGG